MLIRSLGAAAGGGVPQWNCACTRCAQVRAGGSPKGGSTHAGMAVSGLGDDWFLINATPDVHRQIENFPALHPGPGVRQTPLAGVLLTDAEFDHTIGLLLLREGAQLDVWATAPVLEALAEAFPIRRLLSDYARFSWRELRPEVPVALDARLEATCFVLGDKRPRYVQSNIHAQSNTHAPSNTHAQSNTSANDDHGAWVVGYRLRDTLTGRRAVYAPGVHEWTPELQKELDAADCVFVDGTFWTEEEMITAGTGGRPAASMGHLPVGGPHGSAARLSELVSAGGELGSRGAGTRCVYTHINNTNPMLDENSPERRHLDELGIEIALEGWEVQL